MHTLLTELLATLRMRRGFSAHSALDKKVTAINDFFLGQNLDSCVVGLSGGIDSAVVAGLLTEASRIPESPLKRVVGLIVPIYDRGSTGQEEATARAQEVAAKFQLESWTVDMSRAMDETMIALDAGYLPSQACRGMSTEFSNPWTRGQVLSIMRTPVFYGAAARLQQDGHASIVVGTTNRDEGAYLGFWGKASDGMVDLQPISDLHKSEVYQLAEILRVPKSVVLSTPKGDVWDGRSDQQMIGTSYDHIELCMLMMCLSSADRINFLKALTNDAYHEYIVTINAIDRLHTKNKHKYSVGSPSHHLDVYRRDVPDGWRA